MGIVTDSEAMLDAHKERFDRIWRGAECEGCQASTRVRQAHRRHRASEQGASRGDHEGDTTTMSPARPSPKTVPRLRLLRVEEARHESVEILLRRADRLLGSSHLEEVLTIASPSTTTPSNMYLSFGEDRPSCRLTQASP